MENYEIKPKVDEVQEFIEIANDLEIPCIILQLINSSA